jgi:hypothetical protein
MLRKFATVIFVICIACWTGLTLALIVAALTDGWHAIGPRVVHLAGFTSEFGVLSTKLAVIRLGALLLITVAAGFARYHRLGSTNA